MLALGAHSRRAERLYGQILRGSELASASCTRASQPRPIRRRCLKSGKNWFCFVKRLYSKHVSISLEALILQRCYLAVWQKLHLLAIVRNKITKTPWLILTECVSEFGGAALLPPNEAREYMLMPISLESLVRCSREASATRGKLAPHSRRREQDFPRGALALNQLSRS